MADKFSIKVGIELDDSTVASQLTKLQSKINTKGSDDLKISVNTKSAIDELTKLTNTFQKLNDLVKETEKIKLDPFKGINTTELKDMLSLVQQMNQFNKGINITFKTNSKELVKDVNDAKKQMDEFTKEASKPRDVKISGGNQAVAEYKKQLAEVKQLQDLIDDAKSKGNVTVKVSDMNLDTGKIEKFSLTIENLNGEVQKLKYSLSDLQTGDIYKLDKIDFTDGTDKALKKLEKQKQKYQEILDGFKNTGVLGDKNLKGLSGLLNVDAKDLNVEAIQKEIRSLGSQEKDKLKDIASQRKMLEDQLKYLKDVEARFNALKLTPNTKSADITAYRNAIKEAQKMLDDGTQFDKIKMKVSTGGSIDNLGVNGLVRKIGTLETAYKKFNQEDLEALNAKKKAQQDIFNIQDEIIKQTRVLESLTTGDKTRGVTQQRKDDLEVMLNQKKTEYANKYGKASANKIDAGLLDTNGNIDFSLTQKRAKELDSEVNKLNADLSGLEEHFKNIGKIDAFNDLKNQIASLDPTMKAEDLKSKIADISQSMQPFAEEFKTQNEGAKQLEKNLQEIIQLEKQKHEIEKQMINANGEEATFLKSKRDLLQSQVDGKVSSGGITVDNESEALRNLKEMNTLELNMLKNKKLNKDSTKDVAEAYALINKLLDNIFKLEKQAFKTTDETLKGELQAKINELKAIKTSTEGLLTSNSGLRDANKDTLLQAKEKSQSTELANMKSSAINGGSSNLAKFIKDQEKMLTGLEGKFANVLNPDEVKSYVDALKTFNPTAEQMVQEMESVMSKHRQFKAELQERSRIAGYGEKVEGSGLNLQSSMNDVQAYIKSVTNGKGQITQFNDIVNENGKKIRQMHYTVDEGNNRFTRYTMTLDDATASLYRMGKGTTDITNRKQSLMDMLKGAFQSVAGFTLISATVMGLQNAFKGMVQSVNEMDNALTDLNKVVDLSQQQLEEMKMTAIEMGMALGKSGVDIMKAMAEAGRQFKNTEDIKEFVRVKRNAPLYGNI